MNVNISQSSATLTVNQIFSWYSNTAQVECLCQLRIFQLSFDKFVVIVSELYDNPGRSITDEASALIQLVCRQFNLVFSKTMWIEHYPSSYLKEDEAYEQILLTPFEINSQRIKKQQLESLLRISL